MAPCRLAGIYRLLLLILCLTVIFKAEAIAGKNVKLRRQKREWVIPPAKLQENVDYTNREYISKVRSDKDEDSRVTYSLSGIGADRPPINLFIINPSTGYVKITGLLDREECQQYNLTAYAKFYDGRLAENTIELKVVVLDQNDNAPIFHPLSTSVRECSQVGTVVGTMTATDADEEGHNNSKIAYSILSQEPAGSEHVFAIDKATGEITVKRPILDREVHDSYTLIVQGVDKFGAPDGKTGTGTVHIEVRDINDNVPTLEKDMYSGNVDEGAEDVVVMRIKAFDVDLVGSDNWLAVFHIVSGNEDGLFTIETDPVTNEGILRLVEPADYEKTKEIDLDLLVENVAPFVNGTAIALGFERDLAGPGISPSGGGGFQPKVKEIPVSEDPEEVKVPVVIGSYPATDGDTGEVAEKVRYAKGYDPDNWLTIDETTAEIKLNKVPDRESPFVVNGTYKAMIICMTEDTPTKTVTGTIAINVVDSNDNCPILTSTYQNACTDTKVVYISAIDEDDSANPLSFRFITEDSRGSWEMKPVNDTTAAFWAKESLWPGVYHITVEVSDVQGLTCPEKQTTQIHVCTCDEEGGCGLRAAQQTSSSVNMGMPVIALMFLGMVLMLLVPLLMVFCQCGTAAANFTDLPFDAKEYLIPYHIESNGEDKEVPLLSSPGPFGSAGHAVGVVNISNVATKSSMGLVGRGPGSIYGDVGNTIQQQMTGGMAEMDHWHGLQQNSFASGTRQDLYTSYTHMEQDIFEGIALPNYLLHDYYSQKAICETQNCKLNDGLLVYDYEGQDSSAGSVGCCSLLGSDDDLQFLDNLGPNFTTLAQICKPPKPVAVSKAASSESYIPTSTLPPPSSTPPPIQTSVQRENIISTRANKVVQAPPPPPPIHTMATESTRTTSGSATLPRMHLCETVPTQTVLVQQRQPLYYLVEPQVQRTVLLAERPPVALGQGILQVNHGPVLQRVIPGPVHTPTSPTLLLQGGQTLVQHSTLPRATIAGSQHVVLVQRQAGDVALVQGPTFTLAPQQMQMPTPGQERVILVNRQVGEKPDAPGSVRTLWPTDQLITEGQTLLSPTMPTNKSVQLSSERDAEMQTDMFFSRPEVTSSNLTSLGDSDIIDLVADQISTGYEPVMVHDTIPLSLREMEVSGVETETETPSTSLCTSVPAIDATLDTTQPEETSEEIQGGALDAAALEAERIDSVEKATEEASNELSELHIEATMEHVESLPVSMQTMEVTASSEMSVTEEVIPYSIPIVTEGDITETIVGNTDLGREVDEFVSDTTYLSVPEVSPGDTDIIDLVAGQISAGHPLQCETEIVQDTITLSAVEMEMTATQDTHAEETENEVSNTLLEDTLEAEELGRGQGDASYVDGPSELTPSGDVPVSLQETTAVSITELSPDSEVSLETFQGTDPAVTEASDVTYLETQQASTDQVLVKTTLDLSATYDQITTPDLENLEGNDLGREVDGMILSQAEASMSEVSEAELHSKVFFEGPSIPAVDLTTDTTQQEDSKVIQGSGWAEEHVEVELASPHDQIATPDVETLEEDKDLAKLLSQVVTSMSERDELTAGESLEPSAVVTQVADSNIHFLEADKPVQAENEPPSHEQSLRGNEGDTTLDVEMPDIPLRQTEQDLKGGSLVASDDQLERDEETQEPINEEDMSEVGSMDVECSTAHSEQTDYLSELECVEEEGLGDAYDEAILDTEVTPTMPEETPLYENEDRMVASMSAQSAAPDESEVSIQTVQHTMTVEKETVTTAVLQDAEEPVGLETAVDEPRSESAVEVSLEHHMPDVAQVEEAGTSCTAEGELEEAMPGHDQDTEVRIDLGGATTEQSDSQIDTGEEVEVNLESEDEAAVKPEAEILGADLENADTDVVGEEAEKTVTTAVLQEAEEPVGLEVAVEEPESESAVEVSLEHHMPDVAQVEEAGTLLAAEEGESVEAMPGLDQDAEVGTDLEGATAEQSGSQLGTEEEEEVKIESEDEAREKAEAEIVGAGSENADTDVIREEAEKTVTTAVLQEAEEPVGLETAVDEPRSESAVEVSLEHHMPDVAQVEEAGTSCTAEGELEEAMPGHDQNTEVGIDLGGAAEEQPDSQIDTGEEVEVNLESEDEAAATPEAEILGADLENADTDIVGEEAEKTVTTAVLQEAEEPVGLETAVEEPESESAVEISLEHHMPDAQVEEAGTSCTAEGELEEAMPGHDQDTEVGIDLGGATADLENADTDVVGEEAEKTVTTAVLQEAEEPVGLETAVEEPESQADAETQQGSPQLISVEAGQQQAEPQARRVEIQTEEVLTLETVQTRWLQVAADLDLQTETVEDSSSYLSAATSQEMEPHSPTEDKQEEQKGTLPEGQEMGATAVDSSSSVGKKGEKASKKGSKGPKSPKSPVQKCKQQ